MKRGRLILGLMTLLALNAAPVIADDVAQRLESIVLDTFDDPETRTWIETGKTNEEKRQWVVVGSKFSTKEGDIQFPRKAFPEVWPAALFDTNPDGLKLHSLGIEGKFDRKGFNYVEIYPAKEGKDGKLEPYGLPLPGITKAIDLWVWGSMYKYTIEIHIRDANGIPYVLPMGSLWYQGWKNLTAVVPTHIKQMQTYVPRYLGLTLTKIVIRTEPSERVDHFYVYIDQLKTLTDMHQNPFDGREMIKPAFLEKTWGVANQGK